MDEAKLKEIEDRAAKATAGPWVYFGEHENNVFWGEIRSAAEDGHFDHITDTPELDERDNDMEFIAHARQDVPALCESTRTAQQDAKELYEALENFQGDWYLYCLNEIGREDVNAASSHEAMKLLKRLQWRYRAEELREHALACARRGSERQDTK